MQMYRNIHTSRETHGAHNARFTEIFPPTFTNIAPYRRMCGSLDTGMDGKLATATEYLEVTLYRCDHFLHLKAAQRSPEP